MINAISQSLGLDLVNINVIAKVCQNIPNSLRVIDIFRFLSGDKNRHKLSGDKIKCLTTEHTLKVNIKISSVHLCFFFFFVAAGSQKVITIPIYISMTFKLVTSTVSTRFEVV